MTRYPTRTASFIITLLGLISNSLVTIQVLAAWRSIKWEPESEWESTSDKWSLNGLKIAWGLLLLYFSSAAAVCAIGFAGVIKSKPVLVKFYRDYSIADFSFCAFLTFLAAYGASLPTTPLGLCESLSRQTELMRDLAELGLSSENCERWFKKAAIAFLGVMFLALVARLHFILAISIYYSHLFRHYPGRIPMPSSPTHSHSHSHSRSSMRKRPVDGLRRVYLLPRSITELQHCTTPISATAPGSSPINSNVTDSEEIIMYAPVPLSSLPGEVALNLKRAATEGWVRTSTSRSSSSSSSSSHASSSSTISSSSSRHRDIHRHHHTPSSSHLNHTHVHANADMDVMTGSGQINLPISPDEELFPRRIMATGVYREPEPVATKLDLESGVRGELEMDEKRGL